MNNPLLSHTTCQGLDKQSEIIIFESLFITFEASSIFIGSWGNSKHWLDPKTKPP